MSFFRQERPSNVMPITKKGYHEKVIGEDRQLEIDLELLLLEFVTLPGFSLSMFCVNFQWLFYKKKSQIHQVCVKHQPENMGKKHPGRVKNSKNHAKRRCIAGTRTHDLLILGQAR